MSAALQLIKTIPKEKPDYATIHFNAAVRSWERFKRSSNRTDILKAVNHGVRAVLTEGEKKEDTEYIASLCKLVECFLQRVTPRELMQVFPIDKEYDGERWQTKDYFYTMREMEAYGLDRLVGDGESEMLLWDYMNMHIRLFQVAYMSAMSDLYRRETGEGIMEKFLKEQGINPYIMKTDSLTGRQYLCDSETGQTMEVKKPRPRYLKVVNGGAK